MSSLIERQPRLLAREPAQLVRDRATHLRLPLERRRQAPTPPLRQPLEPRLRLELLASNDHRAGLECITDDVGAGEQQMQAIRGHP